MSTSNITPGHRPRTHGPHADEVVGILPSRGCHDGNAHETDSGEDPLAEELDDLVERAAAESKELGKPTNAQKDRVKTAKKK